MADYDIKHLWWYLKDKFKLSGWGFVQNPFFLSCPESWEQDNIFYFDKQSKALLELKEKLYKKKVPIKEKNIFIIDRKYTLKYIDPEFIRSEIEGDKEKFWFLLEHEEVETIVGTLKQLSQKWMIQDQQIQIVSAITREFDIFKWGLIEPTNKAKSIVSLEWDKYTKISWLLNSPFRIYIEWIQEFERWDVEDVVLKKEFEKFYNEDLPTPYVSLLMREKMVDNEWKPFTPWYWQLYFHYNMKRFNYISSCRQSGKTYDSCWLAWAITNIKWRNDVIYIVQNESLISQPWEYFERFMSQAKDYWIFTLSRTAKPVPMIKNNITGNTIRFVSASSKMGPRSFSAKHVFFDEPSYISDDVWDTALPIILNNDSNVYCFSTINWDQSKDQTEWFYKELVNAEFWLDEQAFAMRVTIDDIEYISTDNKERMKARLKNNPDKYYAELYATIPPKQTSIVWQWFFVPKPKKAKLTWTYLIWYDPAKNSDSWGVILLNQATWCFEKEWRLQNMSYYEQYEFLKKLKKTHGAKLAMDITWVWEAVYEIMRDIVDYTVRYTWGNNEDRRRVWTRYTYFVPKKSLVDNFSVLAEDLKITALVELSMLQTELSHFVQKKTAAGNRTYEAKKWFDDLINACLVAAYIYKKTLIDPSEKFNQMKKKQAKLMVTDPSKYYEQKNRKKNKMNRMKRFLY